jgi:hypothetical protein
VLVLQRRVSKHRQSRDLGHLSCRVYHILGQLSPLPMHRLGNQALSDCRCTSVDTAPKREETRTPSFPFLPSGCSDGV